MLNTKAIKAQMILKDKTASYLANKMGITPTSFYKKLREETRLSRTDIEVLIDELDIENPTAYFFNKEVS